jgi:hypothetical protein
MKTKVFVQQFFFDEEQTDYVSVKWKSGLHEFYIYHKEKLIQKIEGRSNMNKGVFVEFPDAGNIFIRLVEKPLGFEVKQGDRYLFKSRILANEKLVAISQIFVFTGVINIFTNLDFPEIRSLFNLIFYIPMTLGIFYIVAAYFIRKGYLSLYIIGLIIFTLSTLLSILVFGWAGLFFHVIRLVLLGIIFGHLQYILILQKHEKALLQLNRRSSDLLDDI